MSKGRREFELRPEDEEFLADLGLEWETVKEGNALWLIVHDYGVPTGFNRGRVSVALQVPPNYPATQLDMVYFYPELCRVDGRAIKQLSAQALDGRSWQRWSRHRTAKNPWRPDADGLETHFLLIREWLAREVRRSA